MELVQIILLLLNQLVLIMLMDIVIMAPTQINQLVKVTEYVLVWAMELVLTQEALHPIQVHAPILATVPVKRMEPVLGQIYHLIKVLVKVQGIVAVFQMGRVLQKICQLIKVHVRRPIIVPITLQPLKQIA
jgi:hypothetical protein